MKIKTNMIFLFLYLFLLSLILKKVLYLPFGILILLFFIDVYIHPKLKNLLYICAALTPLPSFLFLFLFYLPFSAFGMIIENSFFIQRYIFGFAISILSTLIIYTFSMFISMPINPLTISLILYVPVILFIVRRRKNSSLLEFVDTSANDYKIIMISLFFLLSVAHVLFVNDSLFISNGTYIYARFNSIEKSIKSFGILPFYTPNIASGDNSFFLESATFYTHMAFIKFLFPIDSVLFFNYYAAFILFLTILAVSLLIKKLIEYNDSSINPYIIAIGSCAVGLSFIFVQTLESFKHFFTHPIGFLIFSLVLSNPKKINEFMILFFLYVLSFVIHPAQTVGNALISFFMLAFLQFPKINFLQNLTDFKNSFSKNKLKTIAIFLAILMIPFFYFIPVFYYNDFLRESSFNLDKYTISIKSHLEAYIRDNHISIKYPDLNRNDDRKIGAFFSAFGIISIVYSLINFRKKYFQNSVILILAYFFSIIGSALIETLPHISNMEYGIRMLSYELVILVVISCSLINSFNKPFLRWAFFALLLAGFLHTLPYIKTNLKNIHHESFISGQGYYQEIEFIKKLPLDGRIITYGHYSNAVEAGLSALTGKYFARYEFKQFDVSKTPYEKIHSSHSWGYTQNLEKITGIEFVNYLKIGGYKYLFLNICHPVGDMVIKKVYPNFSYPIYQNQCNVILVVNNTYYAEKVKLVEESELGKYRPENYGNLYISTDGNYTDTIIKNSAQGNLQNFTINELIKIERLSPVEIILGGNFEENDIIVFKETYFPRWKAYVDSKEVQIFKSSDDLILIKAVKGNVIKLNYSLALLEKISGLISILGILLLLVLLVFLF